MCATLMRFLPLLALVPVTSAASLAAQDPWTTLEVQGLAEWSLSGAALDLDGDTLFFGAPHFCAPALSPPTTVRGSVSAYTRIGGVWHGPVTLQSSTGHADDAFGISIDVDGDLAFVGASGDDTRHDRAGAVYVFERIQGVWTEVQRLTASDAVHGDGFGGAVAHDNGRLLVGAPLEGHGHYAEWGECYAFERQGGVFVETQRFRPPGAVRGDWFGYRVDVAGDRAAISSYSDGTNGVGAGSVWLYEHVGRTWQPVQRLLPSDGHAYGHFGVDVRLGPGEVVIGSHRAGHAGAVRGGVYVFRPGLTGWEQAQRLTPVGLPDLAALGASVAYSERGTLLAGAPGVDQGRGRIYEFERAASGLFELAALHTRPGLAPYDFLGLQVRGEAGEIVASMPHHIVDGLPVGGASVFEHGRAEATRPYCEAPINSSGTRGELASLGALTVGAPLELALAGLPSNMPVFVLAAFPTSAAPALFGSCLVGPTAPIVGAVTDSGGAARLSVPASALGPFLTPGTTFLLEARGPRAVSTGGALGAFARTHALELRVRP
jgi:hypothetical protein